MPVGRTPVVKPAESAMARGGSVSPPRHWLRRARPRLSYASLGIQQNNPRNASQMFTYGRNNGFTDYGIDTGTYLF
jgi:hypothetical protein